MTMQNAIKPSLTQRDVFLLLKATSPRGTKKKRADGRAPFFVFLAHEMICAALSLVLHPLPSAAETATAVLLLCEAYYNFSPRLNVIHAYLSLHPERERPSVPG